MLGVDDGASTASQRRSRVQSDPGRCADPTLVRGAIHDNRSSTGRKVKAGSTSSQLTSLGDVMATVAAVVGAKLPDSAAEDSFRLLPAWLGEDHAPIRPYFLPQAFGGQRTLSVRRGDWQKQNYPKQEGHGIPKDF